MYRDNIIQFNRAISCLRELSYYIQFEYTDLITKTNPHIQLKMKEYDEFIYVDFLNETVKAWTIDVNGQRPTELTIDCIDAIFNMMRSFYKIRLELDKISEELVHFYNLIEFREVSSDKQD